MNRVRIRRFLLGLWLLWSLLGATPQAAAEPFVARKPDSRRHLALLIGINHYEQAPAQKGKLPWPVLHTDEDLRQVEDVLTRHHRFLPADILVLREHDATKEQIRAAFRSHLLAKAEPGAVIVFYFAGHGTQVVDTNGDELDGMDEALVTQLPTASRGDGSYEALIRDDEIALWLQELQSRLRVAGKVQGSINFFIDSCFAGSIHRDSEVVRGRGAASPERLADAAGRTRQSSAWPALAFAETLGDVIVMTAARGEQTAKERRGMGAFTWALVSALSRAGPATRYRELLDLTVGELGRLQVEDQTPQLEGKPDLLVFDGTAALQPPFYRVELDSNGRLILPLGQLQLVTRGSIYSLHRATPDPPGRDNFLLDAKAETIWATESELRPIAEAVLGPQGLHGLAGTRAVEKSHRFIEEPIRAKFIGLDGHRELIAKCAELGILRDASAEAHPELEISLAGSGDAIELHEVGSPAVPRLVRLDDQPELRIAELLRARWRWRRLHELVRDNPAAKLELRMTIVDAEVTEQRTLARPPTPRRAAKLSNDIEAQLGDLVMFELHNPTQHDLYGTVIELAPAGEISLAFPRGDSTSDQLIASGQTRMLNLPPYLACLGGTPGRSLFRVIATAKPIHFGKLVQRAYQAELRGQGSNLRELVASVPAEWMPLAQLLALSVTGAGERSLPAQVPLDGWGTSEARLLVRPRGPALKPCADPTRYANAECSCLEHASPP